MYPRSDPTHYVPILYTVLEEVAASKGVEPVDLPSILDSIDPDGLEDVVKSFPVTGGSIQFTYAGCTVRVSGNGYVAVDCSSHRALSEEKSASHGKPPLR